MQFNRDDAGVMHKLPKPSVDTGMGLERLAAVLQGVHGNYEIDLFVNLLAAAKQAVDAAGAKDCDSDSPSLKVIADHIRACAFTVADGVIPGNEGRGYVLRRIARRAIRHGYKLGARKPFFHTLVAPLADEMGDAYPELRREKLRITEVLQQEEERFFQTIANGMEILEKALGELFLAKGHDAKVLDGDLAFKLHDTYGFPLDLTADVCRESGIAVDGAAFDAAMNRQREQARAAGKFKMAQGLDYDGAATAFHGYEHLVCEHSKVTALYVDGTPVARARAGDDVVVVLDHTPFYAESGGQAGDTGELRNARARVLVDDTIKVQASVFGHSGRIVEGEVEVGDTFSARVDADRRARTMRNHSVTHLMHKALREVLGGHVQQKGSLVNHERTRFDFAHNAPMTAGQIARVEQIVNAEILANVATDARTMSIDEAQKHGAVMLFGEKYGDTVRVLDIGSSRELCGGTHVQRTGDIGLFKIVAEGGVAAGVRRVEAVTGDNALAYLQQLEAAMNGVAGTLKAAPAEVGVRLQGVLDQVRALEREVAALKGKLASSQGDELLARAVDVKGIKVLAATLEGADAKTLRETMDKLKDKLKTAAIVLAAVDGSRVQLAAGVTADSTARVKAGELVNFVAQQVGGKGGGKPDLAMAGGTDASKLAGALASVAGWVGERV
jgi:alanyl-tRNA synthetase